MPYLYKTGHQYGNNTVNIIGKACLEVTQAQYDALSYAEKNDGTIYFVKDGTPESLIVNDSSPIGAMQAYGGDTAPEGWLICDGSLVSRTTYSELFDVIGETYGAGDGSTTFNLPDLRGRVIIGEGTGTATDATAHSLGDVDGKETHTLDITEMPSHNHSGSTLGWTPSNMGSGNAFRAVTDGSTNNTGGGLAHNNMQPYLVCNYIIKAKDTSTSETTLLSMVDYFYPVGSYYETSDDTFNPNTVFGGTWEKVLSNSDGDYLIDKQTRSVTVASGMHGITFSITTPTGYYVESCTVIRTPNPNWVYGSLASITNTSVEFVYNNTYSASITGDLMIEIIFKNSCAKYRWHRTA